MSIQNCSRHGFWLIKSDAFKIQSHLMFYDTKHNAVKTVVSNLNKAFAETAEKMCTYWRCLPPGKRPENRLVARNLHPAQSISRDRIRLTSSQKQSPKSSTWRTYCSPARQGNKSTLGTAAHWRRRKSLGG